MSCFRHRAVVIAIAIIALLQTTILVALGIAFFAKKLSAPPQKSTEKIPYSAFRRGLFALSRMPTARIAMVGDSLTEAAPWDELTGCPHVLNRGINGDTSAGVLNRLNDVLKLQPRAVFVMIGVNDVIRGISKEQVLGNIEAMLERLKAAGISCCFAYILPVSGNYSDKPINAEIDSLNLSMGSLLTDRFATVDFRQLVTDSKGNLREELTYDGLHLTPQAYEIWRDAIAPHIAQYCLS